MMHTSSWPAALAALAAVVAPAHGAIAQVNVPLFAAMNVTPSPFLVPDYTAHACAYLDRTLNLTGGPVLYQPVAWNESRTGFIAVPSYISGVNVTGDDCDASGVTCAHEAITSAGTVLSAALAGGACGHDSSVTQWSVVGGSVPVDLYAQLGVYFTSAGGSRTFSNNEGNNNTAEWWYQLWPSVAVFMAASSVRASPALDTQLRDAADAFAAIVAAYSAPPFTVNDLFNATGFNFTTYAPFFNGAVVEHDAAAGIAYIVMQAYYRFNCTPVACAAYLNVADACLTYLSAQAGARTTILYEILAPLAVYTAARMNADAMGRYDLDTLLNAAITPRPPAPLSRPTWGIITDVWQGVSVHGLVGSTTDSDGYGFAFNTMVFAAVLAPVARYNASYARAMGRYATHACSSARLLLPAYVPPSQQDSWEWSSTFDPGSGVMYEGVRAFGPSVPPYNAPGPWATGDHIRETGAGVNLTPYGGAYIGLLAALCADVSINGTRLDLARVDAHARDAMSLTAVNLLYLSADGPAAGSTVALNVTALLARTQLPPSTLVDVVDDITGDVLAVNASGLVAISLQPDQVRLITLLPVGSQED